MFSEFSRFESMVQYILGSGRAPSASIHQDQRIILRFDKDQELISPFFRSAHRTMVILQGIQNDQRVSQSMKSLRDSVEEPRLLPTKKLKIWPH